MSNVDIYGRTFSFACRIVKLCQAMDQGRAANQIVTTQLLTAGISAGATLAGARSMEGTAEFGRRLSTSRAAANETAFWLRLIAACEIVDSKEVEGLLEEANQIMTALSEMSA